MEYCICRFELVEVGRANASYFRLTVQQAQIWNPHSYHLLERPFFVAAISFHCENNEPCFVTSTFISYSFTAKVKAYRREVAVLSEPSITSRVCS